MFRKIIRHFFSIKTIKIWELWVFFLPLIQNVTLLNCQKETKKTLFLKAHFCYLKKNCRLPNFFLIVKKHPKKVSKITNTFDFSRFFLIVVFFLDFSYWITLILFQARVVVINCFNIIARLLCFIGPVKGQRTRDFSFRVPQV